MVSPKQATLNEWVNLEALQAYAERLQRMARGVEDRAWLDGPTELQVTALAALAAAEAALREALELALLADGCMDELFGQEVYGRGPDLVRPSVAEAVASLTAC